MSEERFDRIDKEMNGLRARIDGIDQRIGVLHEDLISRIAAVSERKAVTEDQFAAGMADLKESIGRRLDPIELAVRTHTAEIAELKRAR